MASETLSIVTQLVNTLRFAVDQLEANYQQAVSKGHHWPNERVNMTSAAKVQANHVIEEARKFIRVSD